MLVSFLQLMGFASAKTQPASRENPKGGGESGANKGITAVNVEPKQNKPRQSHYAASDRVALPGDHAGQTAVKKLDKPQAASKAPAKKASKVALQTKAAKPAPGKKADKKTPAVKSKAAVKAIAKPVAKAAVKSPPKKPQKAPAKVLAKTPQKPVATKATQVKAAKAPAKPPAKPKVQMPKAPVKVTPKPVAKAAGVPKKTTQTAKVTTVSPAKKIKPSSSPSTVTATSAPTKVSATAPVVVAAASSDHTSLMPTRMARPSARLTQITVPSMAQAVASTAAKSSYSQIDALPAASPAAHVAVKKDPKLANNWKTKTAAELTDREVSAMPDSEYMNDKQMAFFRHKLVGIKQEILNSADETTEHLREDTVIVPDPADRATIEEEHALELRTRDRERKLLKKIEQSIARIDANDYGYCDETGEPIGVGRLMARPTATLSLEAQQRRELKQKMFGD
jgi:DnaK suppressor protein